MPATVSRRSSISRKDIWQPEQPSSQTVARRFLLMGSTHGNDSLIFLLRIDSVSRGLKPVSLYPAYAALKGRSSTLVRLALPRHEFRFFHAPRFSSFTIIHFLPASWSGKAGTAAV